MPKPAVACLVLLLELSRAAGGGYAASAPAVAVHFNFGLSTRNAVTLIDPDTFAVLGTAEFKGLVQPLRFDPTGSSLVLVTSHPSKKKPVTLWTLETRSMESKPVADLGRGAQIHFADPNAARVYVVAGKKKSKPKTISAFDLAALEPLGRLASVEHMTGLGVSPDGALLYAFCEGQKHKKPKGPPGNLHVLDARTGTELARLDVGRGASGVAFDVKRGLAYVMGAAGADGNGTLTVLRGASVAARLDVRGRPAGLRFDPAGGGYLLTSRAVVALDAEGVALGHTFALGFAPSDLLFDPEHDLMFSGAGVRSTIAALRMSSGEVLVEHPTGSPGRKLGKGIGAALVFVVAVAAAAGGAPVGGPGFTVQSSTSMVLGEGGALLYVLNPYTNDVSIFDVAKLDVVDIVHTGGGSQRIVQLPGDPDFWVQSRENLAHFDTATNRIDRTIDFHEGASYKTVSYETTRERAWICTRKQVLVFDLRTGEAVGQADLPAFAHVLWFDPSREVEPGAPHP